MLILYCYLNTDWTAYRNLNSKVHFPYSFEHIIPLASSMHFCWGEVQGQLMLFKAIFLLFGNTIYWRDSSFSIVWSWHLCQKSIDHKCWVYFWDLCPALLVNVSVFMWLPGCFDYCSFVMVLKSGSVMPPAVFFFFKSISVLQFSVYRSFIS